MLGPVDVGAAAESLRRLLTAVEAGEVEASAAQRDYLAGAARALEQLGAPGTVREPDV